MKSIYVWTIVILALVVTLLSSVFTIWVAYETGMIKLTMSSFFQNDKENNQEKIPEFFGTGRFVQAYGSGKEWTGWDKNRQKYFTIDGGKTWAPVVD